MRYVQTTPPTAAPVSLADVLLHSRIDEHADDAYVAGLIDKATRVLERELSRQFVTATWTLYLDEFPAEIQLIKLPVATVTSVAYTDTSGDTQTLTAVTDYQTNLLGPDMPGLIKPAYGMTWPSTKGDTYNAVTVIFTAGYGAQSAVPASVKHMIASVVAHWYENREPVTDQVVNPIPYGLGWIMSKEDWGGYA